MLLTGGPAVGKSTTARRLAAALPRAAVIDVDDIRQLVVAGDAAPWDGAEGCRQQRLGVLNAAGLANRFLAAGIDVVVADVVTNATLPLYREQLAGLLVVQLQVAFPEAQRRATLRPAHLTEPEFAALYEREAEFIGPADHCVDTTTMTLPQQIATVERLWCPVT